MDPYLQLNVNGKFDWEWKNHQNNNTFYFNQPPIPTAFIEVGGYTEVTEKFFQRPPNITRQYLRGDNSGYVDKYWECGEPPENSLHLFRWHTDPSLPWTGITFGLTISAVWYWCSDQVLAVHVVICGENMWLCGVVICFFFRDFVCFCFHFWLSLCTNLLLDFRFSL